MSFSSEIRDFTKNLRLATAGIEPNEIAAQLAALAKTSLSEVIQSGEGSPLYDRYVNGRYDADESTVVPPGPILYDFHWWSEIIEFALATLEARSPVKTGKFKASWQVTVNNEQIEDYSEISIGSTVMIVNVQPYARKIEVGHMHMSLPSGVAEDAVLIVRRHFGNVAEIRKTMTTISGGYILKGFFTKGVRQFARTKLRRDTTAGAEMTYPAISINLRR